MGMDKMANSLHILSVVLWTILKILALALRPWSLVRRKDISGQVALVTGGGNGLGRQLCLRLAEQGADVVIWDVDLKAAEETKKAVQKKGVRSHVFHCDVSDREAVYRTAALVKKQVGTVDILVNNAGVASIKSFHELPDQVIEKVYAINIMSHYWTCKAFLQDMVDKGSGHVLAVASAAGLLGGPKMCDYSATKHAVMGFMESLQMELLLRGAKDVHTTVACPYFMQTELFRCDFDGVLPFLDLPVAAGTIVDAVLRNRTEVVLPGFLGLIFKLGKFVTSPSLKLDLINVLGGVKVLQTIKSNAMDRVEELKPKNGAVIKIKNSLEPIK